jgi:hypothetical protein
MKTHQWQLKYIEWFSAEEMHEAAKNWVSELNFVRDEQYFFEHLLQQFSKTDVCSKVTFSCQTLLEELAPLQKECNLLVSALLRHRNKLYILLDGINQIEEEDFYRETHEEFVDVIGEFLMKHNQLKKDVFETVKVELRERRKDHLFLAS